MQADHHNREYSKAKEMYRSDRHVKDKAQFHMLINHWLTQSILKFNIIKMASLANTLICKQFNMYGCDWNVKQGSVSHAN